MSLLDDVLRLVREGERSAPRIAARLGVSREEVEGALRILESMGYVEIGGLKVDDPCSSCPLRRVCGRSNSGLKKPIARR